MSPAQETIDNGEGSSSSTAADATAANPPPAPTPPSGEAYLRSRKDLPRLIMAVLEYDEEMNRISERLRNLPIQRELAFNEFKDPNSPEPVRFEPGNNTHIGTVKPHYNVTASLVFCTGRQLKDGEVCCGVKKCMRGIFPLCIVPAEDDDPQMTSKRACANCQYDGMGSKCPREREAATADDDDDDEMDVDEEYVEDEDDEEYQQQQEEEEEEEESMFVDE